MDRDAVLAAFDDQIRRRPESGPGVEVVRGVATTRVVAAADGWSGVTWSDLAGTDVDVAISAEVAVLAMRRVGAGNGSTTRTTSRPRCPRGCVLMAWSLTKSKR
jgi:hypothetical protein